MLYFWLGFQSGLAQDSDRAERVAQAVDRAHKAIAEADHLAQARLRAWQWGPGNRDRRES